MTEKNEVRFECPLVIDVDGKAVTIKVSIHRWEAYANKPAGSIEVEGREGSYNVRVSEGSEVTTRYTGGLEHALVNAFRLRKKFIANGCK